MGKFLGFYVNPAQFQSEGLAQVFDNLAAVGTNAVCTIPYAAVPVATGVGRRFPHLHIDGHRRILARPVWGKHALDLWHFLTYDPDLDLYAEGGYQPPTQVIPADVDRELTHKVIAEAHSRQIQVHLLLHPFLPPNIRPDDQPVYVDGSRPTSPQVARYGCLNTPIVQAYGLALIEDTIRHFPDIDGLFLDWAEYGAYQLQDHFACFCPHCQEKALAWGVDWDGVRHDVKALWDWLHNLTPARLQASRTLLQSPSALLELLAHYPGWLNLLRFKAFTVTEFHRRARQLLDDWGFTQVTLSARGWPPPWNRTSGMDYRVLAEICAAVTPKLFTFDYCAVPRWYGETLKNWNPALTEADILDALVDWLDLPDDIAPRQFAAYHIPSPGEPHPAHLEAYQRRLNEVSNQVEGRARLYPYAHAYLPESQWEQMVGMICHSDTDGMWVQMYGYMSDAHFDIVKRIWR